MFAFSVVSNLRLETDSRDFNLLVEGFFSVLIYMVAFAGGMWAFYKVKGVSFSTPEALCICGYSLTVFVPATALCVLPPPYPLLSLLTAMGLSALFVFKSTWPRLCVNEEGGNIAVAGGVAAYQVLCSALLLTRFTW
ncbi:unnamed protein product [Discosporangium mesarthrocarpum]